MRSMNLTAILMLAFFIHLATAQEGLVAHWSFDALENNIFHDQSGNGYHGTAYGAKLISGKHGNALSFDGEDDYARIPGEDQDPPAVFSTLGKGSIALWFKVNDIPDNFGISPLLYYGTNGICNFFDAANKGLILEVGHSPIHYGSERLYFTMWSNGCTYPSFCVDTRYSISTGVWHHYVAVVGENYNTIYLNGEEIADRIYNFGNSQYSEFFEDAIDHQKFWLGKGTWDHTFQHLNGALDELMIYNKPLNAEEVMQLYEDGTISAIPDRAAAEKIKIFPNPAGRNIYVDAAGLERNISGLSLTGPNGKLIRNIPLSNVSGPIDISGLEKGIYLMRFQTDQGDLYRKVVVAE